MSIRLQHRLVLVGSLSITSLAIADSTNSVVTLPLMSVSASRLARDPHMEPASVFPLDAHALVTKRAIRTTPEALKGIPSVMVQKTATGQGSPFMRGFTGFRTLALVDGIRLNNSVFRDGPNQYWNTVDPLSVSTYDVVLGPGSVMYGSDAVGGLMNAIPVAPPAYTGEATWEPRLFYRGAGAEHSNIGRAEIAGTPTESLGVIGGVSAKTFGDLEGGRDVGRQPHTGYDEFDFDARADYQPSADSRLTLAHQTVDQDDAWRTHRTIYGIEWEGLKHGDDKVHAFDQHRDLTYLRYATENMDAFADALRVTLSHQLQSEDLTRVRADDTGDAQDFDAHTYGVTVQLEADRDSGMWICGADYYRDEVDSSARRYAADGSLTKTDIQGPVADDAAYDLAGLFIADTISVANEALELTPGARYTYAAADANRVKDPVSGTATTLNDDWQAVTASLRALHPLTADRHHVLYASAAQSFRAPNLSDLTRLDSARSNEIETPAPGLDPEQYVTLETGWKARTGRCITVLSYYYTFIDDMIVRTPTGEVIDDLQEVTKLNSGSGYVQGVELTESVSLTEAWSAWATASWMDGEVDAYPTSAAVQERDTISRLMPPTAQIGTRYAILDGRYWAEISADMADKANELSADDARDTQRIPPGGTPGYVVGHVRAGTTIGDMLNVALAVENVTDEDYRIHGSGVNEAGRNVILTADCTF